MIGFAVECVRSAANSISVRDQHFSAPAPVFSYGRRVAAVRPDNGTQFARLGRQEYDVFDATAEIVDNGHVFAGSLVAEDFEKEAAEFVVCYFE